MSGESDLQRMIDSLKALGDLGTVAAPDCAREIREVLEANTRKGVDPYGEVWPRRKKDGEQALQGAEKALYCAPLGNTIVMRIKGPEARHHLGRGTGEVVRKQIPDKAKLPKNLIEAVTKVLTHHFNLMVKK